MTQHTKGPWEVKPYLTPELDEDPMMVYEVIAGDLQERFDNLPVDENEEQALDEIHAENAANAALIAAAPAMYEALKAMLGTYAYNHEKTAQSEGEHMLISCVRQAREALRLAEGGKP